MEKKSIIADAFNDIPKEHVIFARKLGQISSRVEHLMHTKGIKSQKELAQLLGKNESEISKWLNSSHNMTLKSLAKLEAVLEGDIIAIPSTISFDRMTTSCIRMTVPKHLSGCGEGHFVDSIVGGPELQPIAA